MGIDVANGFSDEEFIRAITMVFKKCESDARDALRKLPDRRTYSTGYARGRAGAFGEIALLLDLYEQVEMTETREVTADSGTGDGVNA